ncbi:MAG: Rne/Rng family ribonuclease [Alphaproteobacteria bacterium]|nr:Rne/Rng family ribonuclease [Alphaproteobacteria bacterium]
MTKRMLIDAAHPEETRVVVLDGNRLVEFDYETSTKKQIKGNIYLAKVTRVEPSLQAAFVEYGGNRHGFLAFSEIHPDYYRIPVADREAALEAERVAEADENRREEEREEAGLDVPREPTEMREAAALDAPPEELSSGPLDVAEASSEPDHAERDDFHRDDAADTAGEAAAPDETLDLTQPETEPFAAGTEGESAPSSEMQPAESAAPGEGTEAPPTETSVETLGGDEIEETRRPTRRPFRHYKIQEVIKRRQIMLVQVTKEERGNKGAALTSYISLAGRYCVLMPNTPRGGGVSRKITSANDRRRLKDLMSDLEVPEGMGVIVRTAGSERSKPEIERDLEYLRRLWDDIRELTLKSTAPALIYEEGNIIKRAIRDLYSRDIEEIVVDGEAGYHNARSFMQMLMPDHARRVKLYRDPNVPLFQRYPIEGQLDAIHSPTVQLKSGGYVVINPTEALVSIDVNSGRSTRERNIEETATKTNLEAADEIARQLRLRDLAGLIVIDFIDMEVSRNQHAVERRLKEAMRQDRARIQIGRISPFGLLELSRQRLRPSLLETSTQPCPYCGGTGHIRSTESTALHVLRAIEEEGVRRRSGEISVAVPEPVALYMLNQKRATLQQIEARCGMHVFIKTDSALIPPQYKLERLRALTPAEVAALPAAIPLPQPVEEAETEIAEAAGVPGLATSPEPFTATAAEPAEGDERGRGGGEHAHGQTDGAPGGQRRGRRRRGRRGGRGRHGEAPFHGGEGHQPGGEPRGGAPQPSGERVFRPSFALLPGEPGYVPGGSDEEPGQPEGEQPELPHEEQPHLIEPQPGNEQLAQPGQPEEGRRRRRRGRRGGRRRRGRGGEHRGEPSGGEPVPATPSHETEGFTPPAERYAPPVAETPERPPTPAAPPAYEPTPRAAAAERAPEPAPAEAERQPIQHNVPPAHDVTGPASNPKKGWWRR